jgi:hypothetical protein
VSDLVGAMDTLLADENSADSLYGFPSGTMAALGGAESSQGTNLGTIGNIFQILPSTAANPGYGLPPLDGNSAISAGSYLNALYQGPANGNLATAYGMYQGGAGNPTAYPGSGPVGQFLSSLGTDSTAAGYGSGAGNGAGVAFGGSGSVVGNISGEGGNTVSGSGSGSGSSLTPAQAGADTTSVLQSIYNWLTGSGSGLVSGAANMALLGIPNMVGGISNKLSSITLRFFIVILAFILIVVGIAALALKSEPSDVVMNAIKKAPVE